MSDIKQGLLFQTPPKWSAMWTGMPEYEQHDKGPISSLTIHFESVADREAFSHLIGQTITESTKSLWYPKATIRSRVDKRYKTHDTVNPKHPVYIVSKGRADTRLTSKSLERIGVHYRIVVEPQEFDDYAAVIDPSKILVLPFSNLGQGSIPARNWIWEHALSEGSAYHWILDDNINGFYRLNRNLKIPVATGCIFRAAEDFTERYDNIALSGFNYIFFVPDRFRRPPFKLNTRIYSCILIRNDISFRWRGRYNEDTDLSIRVLKDGYCTILFNTFLANKMATMTMRGGNTDELYHGDGRLLMAQSLQAQHPDIVRVTQKYGRPHHHVNYKIFERNKLRIKDGLHVQDGVNNYGMELDMSAAASHNTSSPDD